MPSLLASSCGKQGDTLTSLKVGSEGLLDELILQKHNREKTGICKNLMKFRDCTMSPHGECSDPSACLYRLICRRVFQWKGASCLCSGLQGRRLLGRLYPTLPLAVCPQGSEHGGSCRGRSRPVERSRGSKGPW